MADAYIKGYCEWHLIKDDKKADKALLLRLRHEMKAIEDEYPAEKIIVLRRFASKLITQRQEQALREQEIEKKVQDMSKEKIGWGLFMSS